MTFCGLRFAVSHEKPDAKVLYCTYPVLLEFLFFSAFLGLLQDHGLIVPFWPSCETLLHIWCHVDSMMINDVHDVGCLHCVLAPFGNLETTCAHYQASHVFFECTI